MGSPDTAAEADRFGLLPVDTPPAGSVVARLVVAGAGTGDGVPAVSAGLAGVRRRRGLGALPRTVSTPAGSPHQSDGEPPLRAVEAVEFLIDLAETCVDVDAALTLARTAPPLPAPPPEASSTAATGHGRRI